MQFCGWLDPSRSLGPLGLAFAPLWQSLSRLPKPLKSAEFNSALRGRCTTAATATTGHPINLGLLQRRRTGPGPERRRDHPQRA